MTTAAPLRHRFVMNAYLRRSALAAALIGIATATTLTGCHRKPELTCSTETSVQLTQSLLADNLEADVMRRIKADMNANGNHYDLTQVKSLLRGVQFGLGDTRTDRAEGTSTRLQCASTVTVQLPANLIQDADAVVAQRQQGGTVSDRAIQNDVNLEGNQIRQDLNYTLQPTDDGKKLVGEAQNAQGLITFLGGVIFDALQKSHLDAQNAANAAVPVTQPPVATPDTSTSASITPSTDNAPDPELQQATQRFTQANRKLNSLWSSTRREVRAQLLPDQQAWLQKRDQECRLNASNSGGTAQQMELARLDCQTAVTNDRLEPLRTLISMTEASTPADESAAPLDPVAAANAAAAVVAPRAKPAAPAAGASANPPSSPVSRSESKPTPKPAPAAKPAPVTPPANDPAADAEDAATAAAAAANAAKMQEGIRKLQEQLRERQ